MQKTWIAGITTLALLLGASEGAHAGVFGDTAQDAYVEAWFLETAESDLEGALRAYQLCVERSGSADRALAAKAVWRMGRIARARGEEEVAVALLERVVAEYPGTDAAARAAEDIASGPVGVAPGLKEDVAVAEAREFLGQMLDDKEAYTTEKWRHVIDTLSVEEILAIHDRRGGELDFLVGADRGYRPDAKIALGLARAPEGLARLLKFPVGPTGEYVVTDALLARAQESEEIGEHLFVELVKRGDDASFQLLRRLLEGKAFTGSDLPAWMVSVLFNSEQPSATDILASRVERALEAGVLTASSLLNLDGGRGLDGTSRASEVLRSAFVRLPPKERRNVYLPATGTLSQGPLLDTWMKDPEPAFRAMAYGQMMRSSEPALRKEGLQLFVAAGPPWDLDLLMNVSYRNEPISEAMLSECLEVPVALRDPMYRVLLWSHKSTSGAILDYALRHGHLEALRAAFLTDHWDRTQTRGSSQWSDVLNTGDTAAMAGLFSFPDRSLPARVSAAIAGSPSEDLRTAFVLFLSAAAGTPEYGSAAQSAVAPFVSDPSPVVRALVRSPLRDGLSAELRLSQLLYDEPYLALQFIQVESDAETLAAAAVKLSTDLLPALVSRLIQLDYRTPLRMAFDRLPLKSPAALEAFRVLADVDLDVVLKGLVAGELVGPVNREAASILLQLKLPQELAKPIIELQGAQDIGAFREVGVVLREQRATLDASWSSRSIARAVQSLKNPGVHWTLPGRRLAELGAKEDLLALTVDESQVNWVRAGLLGLALLGDEEAVRRILDMSVKPGQYAGAVVMGGLPGMVFDFAVRGRVREADATAALSYGPPEYLADFMVGPVEGPSTHRDGSGIDPVIEYLREIGDVKRLIRVLDLYQNVQAVPALLELGAYEEVFAGLPRWDSGVTRYFFLELQRITGIPEGTTDWPKYAVEQQDLITRWRAALAGSPAAVPGGDGKEKDK